MADKVNPHQRGVTDDLLFRYPKAATKTLARIAYRDNPELWTNLETCRNYIRKRRGAAGKLNRHYEKDRSHFREQQQSGDPFGRLPEPLADFEHWDSVNFEGPMKVLVLSDIHVPFYDKPALICALKDGQRINPDMVLLNGDIADHHGQSDYVKDPRQRDFPAEVRAVKDFLGVLRELFKKSKIVYKLGNHEERHIRYMRLKAPELLGIPEFEFESIMGLADNDIQMVGDNRPIRLGKLNVIHGHEYRFAISNPVSPARGLFLKGVSNAICAHFHQSSNHSIRSLEQKVITNWSSGCLSNLHPEWRPINNWNHGFMAISIEKDGSFEVNNMRIIDGKAYY